MTPDELPETLYVFLEEDGDDSYMLPYADYRDIPLDNESKRVGIYKLERIANVESKVELK